MLWQRSSPVGAAANTTGSRAMVLLGVSSCHTIVDGQAPPQQPLLDGKHRSSAQYLAHRSRCEEGVAVEFEVGS